MRRLLLRLLLLLILSLIENILIATTHLQRDQTTRSIQTVISAIRLQVIRALVILTRAGVIQMIGIGNDENANKIIHLVVQPKSAVSKRTNNYSQCIVIASWNKRFTYFHQQKKK